MPNSAFRAIGDFNRLKTVNTKEPIANSNEVTKHHLESMLQINS